MGKSKPKSPDYKGAAEAEAAASKENLTQQTWANRPNQYNPWGSTTWESSAGVDPATGQAITQWSQHENLSPELQDALNAQIGLQTNRSQFGGSMMDRVRDEYGQPMDWGQFGDMQGLDPSAFGQLDPRQLQTGYDFGGLQGSSDFFGPREQYNQEQLRTGMVDPQETVNRMEKSIYDRSTSRLDPQFQQSDEAMEVKLKGQGLAPGDQAYDAAMQNYNMRKTDAYQTAQNEAIMGGQQAAQGMFGMEMQRGEFGNVAQQQMNQNMAAQQAFYNQAQGTRSQNALTQANLSNQAQMAQNVNAQQQAAFGNQAQLGMFGQEQQAAGVNQRAAQTQADYQNNLRQKAIQEEMTKRGLSLNEMNAIISGQQVQNPQFESFNKAGVSQTPQYSQAAMNQGNFDQANYQTGMAGMGGMLGGAMDLAGTAMMFSDRRLKKNIEQIGTLKGYPFYSFDYVWGEPSYGVMSDEINPEAIFGHVSGFDMVDYSKIERKA